MSTRRTVLALLSAAVIALSANLAPLGANANEPIKIGELNSYARMAAFTEPYRKGWQLGFDQINQAGGIDGRMIEVISRDDGGATGDAVRVADELVSRERVVMLFGTFLSNVGLAVADYANQRQVPFIAAEPLTDAITLSAGNPYTFRMRPSTAMQTAMLVDAASDFDARRWAIVAPNYEYGQSAAEAFKRLIKDVHPEAEIVAEQYPALGKIDAGATVAALAQAEPEAIFNVLFGADLGKFVREGQLRGLFEDRPVLSLITGEPEWLGPLGAEAPEGWIVTGYPVEQIDTADHVAFVDAYRAAYGESPALGSLLGYICAQTIDAALRKAGGTETEALLAALEDLEVDTPIGPVTIRGLDNQSTMGAWVGAIEVVDGQGRMTDWTYVDGAEVMPGEDEVRAARPDL
ncbi:MAG: ABC transporter substrate-binding protein [Geminicoccaceae bacterium]